MKVKLTLEEQDWDMLCVVVGYATGKAMLEPEEAKHKHAKAYLELFQKMQANFEIIPDELRGSKKAEPDDTRDS